MFLQDSRYWQLSGPDEHDNDKTCHLSYLALDAADKINIATNLTIRVHDKLDPAFFEKSVEYLFKNKQGWPRYSSDKALMEGFMRCGYSKELARKRVAAGCHWMCIPGMEYTMNDTVKVNLAMVFQVAFQDMMANADQTRPSIVQNIGSLQKIAVDATARKSSITSRIRPKASRTDSESVPARSHRKGVNITDGGANYYNMCIDGAAVAADSCACQQRIDKEGRLTYEELTNHLDANFEGENGEYVRQMLFHSERYGGGGDSLEHGRKDFKLWTAVEIWSNSIRTIRRMSTHSGFLVEHHFRVDSQGDSEWTQSGRTDQSQSRQAADFAKTGPLRRVQLVAPYSVTKYRSVQLEIDPGANDPGRKGMRHDSRNHELGKHVAQHQHHRCQKDP